MSTSQTSPSDSGARQEDRRALFIYPHVVQPENEQLIGYISNISEHGLMLISYEMLAPDWQSEIQINLPKRRGLSSREMTLRLEARWVRPYAQDLYCVGCCFSEITEEQLALIHEIQTVFGFEPGFSPSRWVSDSDVKE